MVIIPKIESTQTASVGRYWRNGPELVEAGIERATEFCKANRLPVPEFTLADYSTWPYNACAYYRPDEGVVICPNACARLAPEQMCRQWSWPGNTTDREPFGVIAHEIGHHVDWRKGNVKGPYFSNFSPQIRKRSGEAKLTSYCDGDHEWFAEMFRLFVTNHALLRAVRPRIWQLLRDQFKPVSNDDWQLELGSNVPARIVAAAEKKVVEFEYDDDLGNWRAYDPCGGVPEKPNEVEERTEEVRAEVISFGEQLL